MSTEFTPLFLFILVGVSAAAGMLGMSALLGPKKTTAVKQMPYESGMDPIGDARQRFDVRYYLVAIVFLLFDVELLFLYPWAASYQDVGNGKTVLPENIHNFVFWEVLAFLVTVVVAYVYAWRRGVFRWR